MSKNREIDSVLGEFLAAVDAGQAPDPQDYLRRYPHLAVPLQEFFANDSWIWRSSSETATAAFDDETPGIPAEQLIGKHLGHYRISGVLAYGGMGVVCRASHTLLQREVAIKLLLAGSFAGPEEVQRIRCEAEAVARLDHPNIVPIYEVGVWQAQPFLVMPLLESVDLQQKIASEQLSPHRAAELVRDLATAVAHAHQRGVVHRDLKPSNVVFAQDGRPMLVDFGLAKGPRTDNLQTASGQLLGTPHYMSPEQARGSNRVGPATDIFGLGGILYAILTGLPPHQGDSVVAILQNIFEKEIDPPQSPFFTVPSDLQAICMRCLRREPELRYPSATELAEDLQRFVEGEATVAGRSGTFDALTRPLYRDSHRESFGNWGKWLLSFGVIIFAAHCVMYTLRVGGFPFTVSFLLPRLGMFAALVFVLQRSRGGQLRPRTTVERPIWSIWIAYIVGLFSANVLVMQWGLPTPQLFAFSSVLAGVGFIATGGQAWGGCYVLGMIFLALSTVVGHLAAPELYFGGTWLAALAVLARRYWQK